MPVNGYQNKFDKSGKNRKNGERAEVGFKDCIKLFFNGFVRKTDIDEELDHIDYECRVKFNVDVKSVKDSETIWIELKNVGGYEGWLYGKSTHFAFERENYYILVKKEDLIELVERLTEKTMVDSPKDCLYKLYSRTKFGRKDLLTKIKPTDLKSIQHLFISKT